MNNYRKIVSITFLFFLSLISHASDKDNHGKHTVGLNLYYNNHTLNFSHGINMDVQYEYAFNRWLGIQSSLGMNRAKNNLNDWREDLLNNTTTTIEYPSLTSSVLANVVGNFYAVNNARNRLKLGFGIEYRNITDIITIAVLDIDPPTQDPDLLIAQSRFEQYNDLGISANLGYQYFWKSGIGINTSFGYNHYFTNLSKRSYDRDTNTSFRVGGANFLRLGVGFCYAFK